VPSFELLQRVQQVERAAPPTRQLGHQHGVDVATLRERHHLPPLGAVQLGTRADFFEHADDLVAGTSGKGSELAFLARAAPPELRPSLKNQAQRYPARGANVRRLDHFNCLAVDPKKNREFFEKYLGFRNTERIVLNDGTEAGMWLTCTNKSYDFAFTREAHGIKGRFHHITYALDSREAILQAADVFLENGVFIETGPHKHAVQQTFFLYVYEPGGNRVEVANAGARLVLAPDWKPIIWTEEERKKGQAWGLKTIESFHTHGTPPLPEQMTAGGSGDENNAIAGTDDLSEKGIAS
jgi:catechol 2,3-dioxygenase-like lactoylglutathione lyase family enzyme